jgi:cytochrome c biogenesis protein CcdA
VLVIASLLLSGFAIVFNAVAIALAFIVQTIEPLRQLWLSRFATIVGVAIFSVLIVLGVTDLAVDISSIRAQEPRTCPICLND